MKLAVYTELREVISTCRSRRDLKECLPNLSEQHQNEKIPAETLISIHNQDLQRKMKKAFPWHNSDEKKRLYYDKFFERVKTKETHIVMDMAKNVDLTPCMLVRFLIDVYLTRHGYPALFDPKTPKRKIITEMLRHPYKMPNPALASAIQEAVLADDIYGPYSDKVRRAIGFEFEVRLKKWCTEQKIEFLSEEDMRKDGYDKTPDIKLVMPIAVDGFVVNWIESKAMFGDEECHTMHVKEQIGPYLHRYGPGLVIYWFGFIDALDCQRASGIGLADALPKTVEKIDLQSWENHPEWEFPKTPHWEPSGDQM